jgi:SSS family solute:Na+ symporter
VSPLDAAVVGAYLLAVLVLSAWLGRRQTSGDDYHVGARGLPWWALGLSTMATQSSANSFIGIPAFVALVPGGGLVWLQYELALPLALLVVMAVFVPVFRGLGLVSIYEYLELRFDRATRLWLAAVFLLSRAAATAVALYAAAVVVEVLTGLSLGWSVALTGGATVLYGMLGGMRAVVWSDVLQMGVLLAGLLACIGFALHALGGPAAALATVAEAAPGRLVALGEGHGLGDGARAPAWGFLVGGFVLYLAYYGVDQSQVQRQLSAASVADARRALMFNAVARFPLTLLYALLGLALAAVWASSPELRAAVPPQRLDFLVPRYIELHLPVGLRGLLVAAVLAAAMSSLDSAVNSLSAATLRDFGERWVTPARELLFSRLLTLAWGAVITGAALQVGGWSSTVVEGINRVGALFYGPLLAAFACGLLDRRARGPAMRAGVLAGLGANLLLWLGLGSAVFWMWWNLAGLLVAVLVTALLSRWMPGPPPLLPVLPAAEPLPRRWVAAAVAATGLIAALLGALGLRPD